MDNENLQQQPLYRHPASYATEHGQLEEYRLSHRANIACKAAIEQAISAHYRDNVLDEAGAAAVIAQYGQERVEYVLVNTIRQMDWDARYSRDNRAWANAAAVPENRDPWGRNRNVDFVLSQAHPGLVDLFTKQVRKMGQERTAPRPSLVEQLHRQAHASSAPKRDKGQER